MSFRSALTGGPSAAVFRPDWFNSSHSLIYTSSGLTLSLGSHCPLPHLLLLSLLPPPVLRFSHAFKGEESRVQRQDWDFTWSVPFHGSWRGDGGAGRCKEGRRRSRDDIYVLGNSEIELAKVQAQSEYTLHPFQDCHIQAQFDLLLPLQARFCFHPCPFACLFVGRLLNWLVGGITTTLHYTTLPFYHETWIEDGSQLRTDPINFECGYG